MTSTFVLSAGVPLIRYAKLLMELEHPSPTSRRRARPERGVCCPVRQSPGVRGHPGQVSITPPDRHSVVTGKDREGVAFHWFVRQSDVLGWVIFAGVPDRVLDGPMSPRNGNFRRGRQLGVGCCPRFGAPLGWPSLHDRSGTLGIDRRPTREEFEILFDSSPNGVMVIDSQGRIVLLNALMGKKFGYPVDELIGQSVEILVPERFRDAHLGLRRAFAA